MFVSFSSPNLYLSESGNGLAVEVLESGTFNGTLSHKVQILRKESGEYVPEDPFIASYTVPVENFQTFLQSVEERA